VTLLAEPGGELARRPASPNGHGPVVGSDVVDGPADRAELLIRVLAGDIDDREACRRLGGTPIELTRWKLRTLEAIEAGDPATQVDLAREEDRLPRRVRVPTPGAVGRAVTAPRFIAAAAVGVLAFAVSLLLILPGEVAVLTVVDVLARWVMYGATLLSAGGVLFLWWIHDGRAGDREQHSLEQVVRAGAITGAVATVLGTAIYGATLTGAGLLGVLDPRNLIDAATGPVAASLLLRLGGLTYIVYAIRGSSQPSTRVVALAGAVLCLSSFLLVGHTAVGDARALVMTSNLLHTTAGAGWVGGLVLLAVAMRHRHLTGDVVGATGIVQRFSRFAIASVAVLVAAGTVLAVVALPDVGALFTTRYGSMVLTKILLVAIVLTVAARNHRTLVPAMVDERDDQAWSHLRRSVGIEVGGLVLVLLATALLVYLSPPA
jgi:putative copper export protein